VAFRKLIEGEFVAVAELREKIAIQLSVCYRHGVAVPWPTVNAAQTYTAKFCRQGTSGKIFLLTMTLPPYYQ
jgi:hypothetical protein